MTQLASSANSCDNGGHVIQSSGPFGVTVWGWGSGETHGAPSRAPTQEGSAGRAKCDVKAQALCLLPIEPDQCTERLGAMKDEVWQKVCSLSRLDFISSIVPTWAE